MTVYLTEKAVLKLRHLIPEINSEKGIRVATKNGGCNGFEYALEIVDQPLGSDFIYQQDRVNIYLDRESAPVLDGVVIDFVEGLIESGFMFENPNATAACSCGKSFSVADCNPEAVPCS